MNRKRGRAVTVSGMSISATTTAQKATSTAGSRTFQAQYPMARKVNTVSAVSALVGDDKGLVRNSKLLVTAVAPKLVLPPRPRVARGTRPASHQQSIRHTTGSPRIRSEQAAPRPAKPSRVFVGSQESSPRGTTQRWRRRSARRRGKRGGQSGEQPPLVEQQDQTGGGKHDQQCLAVGERQDDAAGKHRIQRHRPAATFTP